MPAFLEKEWKKLADSAYSQTSSLGKLKNSTQYNSGQKAW